ncbi:MAG: hypothetical protein KKC24_23900 [Gammaproteobacteria bacterium]|nr:hypothetical protein [Gammaproteobacteria bacterium]MBU0821891.1 hypothetical protein [Gammaproteobacteria bacterium]MBU0844004.1 hypothetical protein [Gammaproteobacteria bacterium]MBU1842255.1 hypothetical protein [Gammaproteobacteria bacterium]
MRKIILLATCLLPVVSLADEATAKASMEAHSACIVQAYDRFKNTSAEPGDIADAVIGKCDQARESMYREYRDFMLSKTSGSAKAQKQADAIINRRRQSDVEQDRRYVIGWVLEDRSR